MYSDDLLQFLMRPLNEAEGPSKSQIERGLYQSAEALLDPIKRAGGPENFLISFIGHNGDDYKTIGDVTTRLEQMAKDIKRRISKDVKEHCEKDSQFLMETFGVASVKDLVIDEGFWSSAWDALKWSGQTLKWIVEKFTYYLRKLGKSWFGQNPIGRLSSALLVISLSESYFEIVAALLGASLPWYIPAFLIGYCCLWVIIEFMNVLKAFNSSTSLIEFVTTKDPRIGKQMNFSKFFRALAGAQV